MQAWRNKGSLTPQSFAFLPPAFWATNITPPSKYLDRDLRLLKVNNLSFYFFLIALLLSIFFFALFSYLFVYIPSFLYILRLSTSFSLQFILLVFAFKSNKQDSVIQL
ncbi:hypothetical protein BX667DRAFT_140999 [Coemansia mojavensis]|nr:hypothetical protein BX667DRAFT_140999 [Coemansia mojavensis]